jgi:PKD repeat protein
MGAARGQSELLGEILLVGAVVLAVGVGGAFVLADLADPGDEPYADVDASLDDGTLVLVHRGGQALPVADLRLRVGVNGTPVTGVTWANGTIEGDGDRRFEFGERFTHPVPGATSATRVSVSLAAVDADGDGAVLYSAADLGGRAGTPTVATPTGSPPLADAGGNRSVLGEAGETVALDGTGTTDPDGDTPTYAWAVVDADGVGGRVDLRGADTATPTLAVTGAVTDRSHAVRVRLRASDASGVTTDDTVVTVRTRGEDPVADAGPDRSVRGEDGANVTLDGADSTDPDGDPLTYEWRIVPGARDGLTSDDVALVDRDTATPEFRVTDEVGDRDHAVTVELTVDDGTGRSDVDTVTVTVEERVEARIEATRDRVSVGQSVALVGLAGPRTSAGVVNFSGRTVEPYDGSVARAAVEDDGLTLRFENDSRARVPMAYPVTDRTVLRFDFASPREGAVHAVGVGGDAPDDAQLFPVYGTETTGSTTLDRYAGGGTFETYELRGDLASRASPQDLVFVTDDTTAQADAVSEFRGVIVYDEDDYTYEWDVDGDDTYEETGKQPDLAFSTTGTREVTLRVTAPDGRERVSNRSFEVDPAPTADAAATPTDPRAGETVTFDGGGSTGAGALSYDWDVDGDGSFDATGETATHSYETPGTYEATLRVTDRNGATTTANVTVTVRGVVDAVNFGGPDRTVGDVPFRADDGPRAANVSGGSTFATTDAIANTGNDGLYRTQRQGEFSYDRQVDNGTYWVAVGYAEIEYGERRVPGFGDRQFDVRVEGRPVEVGLDVYLVAFFRNFPAAHDSAIVRTYEVTVTDGSLNVTFATGAAGEPAANGIVVERTG